MLEKLREEREQTDRILAQLSDQKERAEQAYLASRRWFGKWDKFLDKACAGPTHLANPPIADILAESIQYRDGKVYDLESFCIMPNHGHLVFKPLESADGKIYSLSTIMHSLKRHTARQANLILGQEGAFWQHENYDHFVRDDEELGRIIKYVLHNPVKAGLTDDWTNWKWSFSKYDM